MTPGMHDRICEVSVLALDSGCLPLPGRLRESPGIMQAQALFYWLFAH